MAGRRTRKVYIINLFGHKLYTNTTDNIVCNYYAKPTTDHLTLEDKDLLLSQEYGYMGNLLISEIANIIQEFEKYSRFYFHGGDAFASVEALSSYKNLIDWDNKEFFGSSAGSYLFAKYFWSNDEQRIGEGLGILPIKLYVLFDGNDNNLEELVKVEPKLPLIILKDHESVTLYY